MHVVYYYSGAGGILFSTLLILCLFYGVWFWWIILLILVLSLSPMVYYRVYTIGYPEEEENLQLIERKRRASSELDAFYDKIIKF